VSGMDFKTEWKAVIEELGGESEIRELAREQGFMGWRQGVLQPLIGFDDTWMSKPEIVGLGLLIPSAVLCMSRELQDFKEADHLDDDYFEGYDSLSEYLLNNRKALLALEEDINDANDFGWMTILEEVEFEARDNNVEGYSLRDIKPLESSSITDFVNQIYNMLKELQNTTELEYEPGFTKEFQEEWR